MWKLLIQNIILISAIAVSFNYEENSIQKKIIETEMVADTESIDLRNKLDIMTDELLSKGHAYVLSSGIGNREVLEIISVDRNEESVGGKEVTDWQSVQSDRHVYLLGKRPTGFILLTVHYRHENKTVQITEFKSDFPSGREITTMAMIERWNTTIKANEVIILLAVKSSTADFVWYRLQNNEVVLFWSWSHYKEVSTVLLFSIRNQYKMLAVNANSTKDSTTAEVYNIVFEQTHSDFSLTHTLGLNEFTSSAVVSSVGENVLLFVTQKQEGYVLVYKYKHFASEQYENGHFELHTNLSAPGVTQVVTFHTAYQNYVAFNGDKSQIYRILNSGELNKETSFGYVSQWVVLPVHNYRSEVILFARESNETKLYAWAGVDNGFSEITLPLCQEKLSGDSCFTGIKDGTASILLYNIPSLIVPMYPDNSVIYHFTTTLQLVKTPIYRIVNSLNTKKNFLEDLWKTQKHNISDVRESLKYILRNDTSNTVMEKWVLGNLTTSNLIDTSVLQCGKLGFLTEDSEIYKYVDLSNLESKVDLVKKKLSELGDFVKSTVDLTKFNGILSIKGHTVIESLTVSNMNQFSVNSLLYDTLRLDMPKRIVGSKVIRSLKADEITFSKIKNITALELTYSDNVITINDNLNIDKPLEVTKDITLIEKGTVNRLDLSEDICHVDIKCAGNPSFNSLVVDDVTVHKKVSGENLLSPLNQTDKADFNSVFAGHNLTVLYINGRNWSDLANCVVYKDQDSYITGHTTINGTLYSRGNVKIETLNGLRFPDDYVIMSRASQKVTGTKHLQFPVKKPEQLLSRTHTNEGIMEPKEANYDKSFIRSKESVTEFEKLVLDDFNEWLKNVDLIFSDAEVTGIVSSFVQSNWTNVAADIVHKDEFTDITSQKTFVDSLKIKDNLEVLDLIGDKNVSDLLTTDSEQVIEGISNLHGHITFNNVIINGEWDEVRVETVFNESVKLSDNQDLPDLQIVFISDDIHGSKVETGKLIVSHSVNNVTTQEIENAVKNYTFLFSQPVVLNGSLNAISLSVLGDITLKGKMCGWNLADYNNTRLSLSRNEDITDNISMISASIEDLQVESINGIKVSNIQDYLNVHKMNSVNKDVEIMALYVHGNVTSKQGISHHYNITSVMQHAVWLQNNNYVNSSLTFVDELMCGMLSIHGLVSEQDWNLFAQNVVYKNDTDTVVSGKKTFLSGFSVDDNLVVELVNGHLFKEIITKTSDQMIEGEVKITEDIIIESIDDISGMLNEVDITELSKQCKLVHDEIICEGDVTFATDISVQDLKVSGAVNEEHKFREFVNTLIFKNSSSQIINEAVFSGDIEFYGNIKIRSHMNNIDWNEFTDNVALMDKTNDIKESVIFKNNLKVSKELVVNGELNASTVNSYNLTEWAENAIYLDSPLHILGEKCFTDIISKGNISIEWYDKVDMKDIITLNHKDTIFGVFAFKNLTAGDLQVDFKVNDVRLDEEFENTLLNNGMQTVESGLSFLGDIYIKGNLTATDLINKQNISDVATIHRNETLYGNYYFTCGMQLQNSLKTEDSVSGINITNWKESAILFDKDQTIEGVVTVLGNITFTQPVSGPKSLGDIDLEQLSNSVQSNILDTHQNMKDNLTEVCGETEHLVQKARAQDMSIQYFEHSQLIDRSENNIHSVYHFKAFADDFVAVTGSNCTTDIYQWNKTSAQFTKAFVVSMGRYITHWATLVHSNQTYIVTRSSELMDDKCPYNGTNIWLFYNSTIDHVNKLNENVDAVMTYGSKKSRFYTLDDTLVTEWKVDHRAGRTEVVKFKVWLNPLENGTFVSPASGLGLSVTNGNKIASVLPGDRRLVNISINCTSEKAEYSSDKQQHFLAVATWEETQIHRHSDFIKIYKNDGILFDKLTSWKPSHLNWLSLPGQSWLTFIENSTGLQIYNYKGPSEGFKQELSMDVNATGLLTMSLHVVDKLNAQPYILVFSNISLNLLQPKVLGDPYIGPNVSCYYGDWYKII